MVSLSKGGILIDLWKQFGVVGGGRTLGRLWRRQMGMNVLSSKENPNCDVDTGQEESTQRGLVVKVKPTGVEDLAKRAAEILRSGGVIGVPTDTVYGIAADAQNKRAVGRIYEIKGRDCNKPIAICVDSIDQVYVWGKVHVPRDLLEALLPGPVTLVFERQDILNRELNPATNLIGIRIPNNQFVVSLARYHEGPVALTSANKSAAQSTLEIQEFRNLWSSLDCIFDGGRLTCGEESEIAARAGSTVIDLSRKGCFRIIRDGSAYQNCVDILQKFQLNQFHS